MLLAKRFLSDCMFLCPSCQMLSLRCYSLHLLYSLFIIVNFTVRLTHIVWTFIQAFIANTLYLFLCTRTLFLTINSRQQQRSSVCPLNKGFMVHFIYWLVNVHGSGVASYAHAVSEWVNNIYLELLTKWCWKTRICIFKRPTLILLLTPYILTIATSHHHMLC